MNHQLFWFEILRFLWYFLVSLLLYGSKLNIFVDKTKHLKTPSQALVNTNRYFSPFSKQIYQWMKIIVSYSPKLKCVKVIHVLSCPGSRQGGSEPSVVFCFLSLPTCVNTRPGCPTIWQVWRMDCRPLAAAESWWAGMTVMVWGTVCTVPLNCFLLASSTSSGVQLTPCFSLWAENHT